MTYKINFERYANHFCMPQEVAADDLASMDGTTLKVALLIFRNADKNYSANLLSNLLNVPESKIDEAIGYWIEKGLLLPQKADMISPETVTLAKKKPQPPVIVKQPDSGELTFLLECMENQLKRPVTSVEYKSVIHILEYIKLPADVVIMAVEYCISIDKFNARYLEKLCSSWADSGITSHGMAEQYLNLMKESKQNEAIVKKLFGIQNRSLIDSERDSISRWFGEWHFDLDVIKLAYERSISAINKLSFPYINKILLSWYEKGYSSLEAVMTNEGLGRRSQSTGGNASYDIEELEEYWKNNVPKLN